MKLSEVDTGGKAEKRSSPTRRLAQHEVASTSDDSGSAPAQAWLKWFMAGVLAMIGIVVVFSQIKRFDRGPDPEGPTVGAIPAQYDGSRAFRYLNQLCDYGPRPSGSPAMKRQQEELSKFFQSQGASVTMQTFEIRHPEDGSSVPMANLVASWYPDRPKRFLLCAHYDTRPFPDRDPLNQRGVFVGANDGASGTAGLMELAHHMNDLPADVGVDMVLFDGEEFVWQQGRDDYFLGSTFFAENYRASPPKIPYQAGILLDMIGDRELKIYYEQNSMRFARDVAKGVWKTAAELGVRAFVARVRHQIQDDHIPLNEIAAIPTIDLIDFDYPRPGIGAPKYWHTEQDVPDNCSGESLAAVVWVVHQWLKQQ